MSVFGLNILAPFIFVGVLAQGNIGLASQLPTKVAATTKQENFDSQLVEGQVYRPDLSVITGDNGQDSFGVLRLRNDFDDHIRNEEGKEIK